MIRTDKPEQNNLLNAHRAVRRYSPFPRSFSSCKMGCMKSAPDSSQAGNADAQAVKNFLNQGANLDELWTQFDSNGDGKIDAAEFNNLVYQSLKFFCLERNPSSPPPSQEAMEPFIKKLVQQLQPFVDKDQDQNISKEEFKGYGTYLTTEFKKLQDEINNK